MLTIPDALLCCINSVFFLNFLTISRYLCLNLLTSSFLIHIGMQQLLRQMPTYIEKKHYHVSKKLSIWVLYGTQMLYFNPMIFPLEHVSLVENTVKHIHLQDHRQEINALPFKKISEILPLHSGTIVVLSSK